MTSPSTLGKRATIWLTNDANGAGAVCAPAIAAITTTSTTPRAAGRRLSMNVVTGRTSTRSLLVGVHPPAPDQDGLAGRRLFAAIDDEVDIVREDQVVVQPHHRGNAVARIKGVRDVFLPDGSALLLAQKKTERE